MLTTMRDILWVERSFVRRIVAATFAFAVVYALYAIVAHDSYLPKVLDFRVVYCGERAVLAGSDPYRVEPLRACEHAVRREAGEPDWSVTPYPLPGYAAAVFAPLAELPYDIARLGWIALLVLAFGITTAAVAASMQTSTLAVAFVCAPTIGILQLVYGEPIPFALAALAVAGLALERHRPRLAALAAAAAVFEPHVGLAGCVGLFVAVPAARRTLVLAGVACAALGIVVLGPLTNLEYLRTFLPLQARAELVAVDQYSTSHVAYLLHASEGVALALGTLCAMASLAFGVWSAGAYRARRRLPRAARAAARRSRNARQRFFTRRRARRGAAGSPPTLAPFLGRSRRGRRFGDAVGQRMARPPARSRGDLRCRAHRTPECNARSSAGVRGGRDGGTLHARQTVAAASDQGRRRAWGARR